MKNGQRTIRSSSRALLLILAGTILLATLTWITVTKNSAFHSGNRRADQVPTAPVSRGNQDATGTSSLQFSISGTEVLLVDAQGRRVGFMRETGQTATEIPNSHYFESGIAPPGAESPDTIERSLVLSEEAGGIYRLLIVGQPEDTKTTTAKTASLEYKIYAFGMDEQFNESRTEISGQILSGDIVEYRVTFNPSAGELLLDKVDNGF